MDNFDFSPSFSLETPKYDHGFSDEEVFKIKEEYNRLMREKVSKRIPLTLQEQEDIIIPHIRIHRTEVFILNDKPEKVKKEPKEIKEASVKRPRKSKEPKMNVRLVDRKMTKKQKNEFLGQLAMKMMTEELTEEEKEFYTVNTARKT